MLVAWIAPSTLKLLAVVLNCPLTAVGASAIDDLMLCMSACFALQIWVKPSAEMQYMYGNHVLKSGLGRITDNTPAYTGVVIYSMSDIPLGFGVTAKSTADCRKMDPSGIVVFHQADVGKEV